MRAGAAPNTARPESKEGMAEAMAANASSRMQSDWSTEKMTSPHLSGSDPRIFPGILARDRHSSGSRPPAQADGAGAEPRESPGGN